LVESSSFFDIRIAFGSLREQLNTKLECRPSEHELESSGILPTEYVNSAEVSSLVKHVAPFLQRELTKNQLKHELIMRQDSLADGTMASLGSGVFARSEMSFMGTRDFYREGLSAIARLQSSALINDRERVWLKECVLNDAPDVVLAVGSYLHTGNGSKLLQDMRTIATSNPASVGQ
jgi:hypothetical protein